MKNRMKTQLEIIKMNEIKPNFSSLEREYGYDRRTIKKYYEGYAGKAKTRERRSKLDSYREEIEEKMQIVGVTITGVYQYIVKRYGYEKVGCYCNFYHYVKKHEYVRAKKEKGHPRYETAAGKQAQIDWKEDIRLKSRNGTEYQFNIFNYKLGNSRYCHYVYKQNRRREEVYESLIESFIECGGVPEEVLCDNMSSIVDVEGKTRKVNEKFRQFAKDFGFEIKLCKPRHSYTKGKVESNNKFIDWLKPYDGEFGDEAELIDIIKVINKTVNTQVCQGTGVTPMLLFQDEKEYLKPLPNEQIIQYYLELDKPVQVQSDSLVHYSKKKYSVSPEYIGKWVFVKEESGFVNIYYQEKVIASHMKADKKINYREEDYMALMRASSSSEKIDDYAKENLKMFDRLL